MARLEDQPDVLLIAVGTPHAIAARFSARNAIPPLGAAYLAAVLRNCGFRVRIADLNVPGWTRERFYRYLSIQRPRVIGLSCMTESYRNAIRLGTRIREAAPHAWIVAGGPHVSFEDVAALRTGAFDVIVRGEGERTAEELFPILARYPRLAGTEAGPELPLLLPVRGISFLEGNRVVRTGDRPLEHDLDTLPYPARDLLPMDRYRFVGSILTGRGCPGRCLFCSAAAMAGGKRRCRRPDAVLDEIGSLRARGIREIVFLDDTFTGDRMHLEALLDGLERRRLRIVWTCESRVETVDRKLLRRMARLGCHAIQYGIESGAAETRRKLGKHAAAVEPVLRETHRAGITPVCSLILGLPWEDEDAVRATIETGLRAQREFLARVGFGVLVCYPGTQFWKRSGHFGLKRRTGDFDRYTMYTPTCDTSHLSRDDLRRLQFEATLRQIREMPPGLVELVSPVSKPSS